MVRKDLNDQLRIMEDDIYQRVEKLLLGKLAEGGPNKLEAGTKLTRDYLTDIGRGKWFEIRLRNEEANEQPGKGGLNSSRRSARTSTGASKRRKPSSPRAMTWRRAC